MNPIEIEEALSRISRSPFDGENFPASFLEALGNKPTVIQRVIAGSARNSDVEGGVLQYKNIHLAVSESGRTHKKLKELRNSQKTAKSKVRFILATDGEFLEAEDLIDNSVLSCSYADFGDHVGFFLPLAGVSVIKVRIQWVAATQASSLSAGHS